MIFWHSASLLKFCLMSEWFSRKEWSENCEQQIIAPSHEYYAHFKQLLTKSEKKSTNLNLNISELSWPHHKLHLIAHIIIFIAKETCMFLHSCLCSQNIKKISINVERFDESKCCYVDGRRIFIWYWLQTFESSQNLCLNVFQPFNINLTTIWISIRITVLSLSLWSFIHLFVWRSSNVRRIFSFFFFVQV